jgi:hypothetical protein
MYNMNIQELISNFDSFGYFINVTEQDSFVEAVKARFNKDYTKDERKERVWHVTWNDSYPLGTTNHLSFTIFECIEVSHAGVSYKKDENKFYYFYSFYSFDAGSSDVYDSDNLKDLFEDILSKIKITVKKDDIDLLREVKLYEFI